MESLAVHMLSLHVLDDLRRVHRVTIVGLLLLFAAGPRVQILVRPAHSWLLAPLIDILEPLLRLAKFLGFFRARALPSSSCLVAFCRLRFGILGVSVFVFT